jgi:hypothetical protein
MMTPVISGKVDDHWLNTAMNTPREEVLVMCGSLKGTKSLLTWGHRSTGFIAYIVRYEHVVNGDGQWKYASAKEAVTHYNALEV